jgi:hypothetical protein
MDQPQRKLTQHLLGKTLTTEMPHFKISKIKKKIM